MCPNKTTQQLPLNMVKAISDSESGLIKRLLEMLFRPQSNYKTGGFCTIELVEDEKQFELISEESEETKVWGCSEET